MTLPLLAPVVFSFLKPEGFEFVLAPFVISVSNTPGLTLLAWPDSQGFSCPGDACLSFFTQSTSYLKIQREKLAGYLAKPVDPQQRFCLLPTQIPEFIWQFEQALLHGLRQLNAQFLVGDYVWVDLGGVALLKNVTGAGLWGFRALWHTQCALWLILVILSFLLLPLCLVVMELNHW